MGLRLVMIFSILLVDSAVRPVKDCHMSELTELVLTADMLRTSIRAKLRTGASRRDVSVLIRAYAPCVKTERKDERVYRVPVELIPLEQRVSFLDALNELPNHLKAGAGIAAPVAA